MIVLRKCPEDCRKEQPLGTLPNPDLQFTET
jgi:hypothetical protein